MPFLATASQQQGSNSTGLLILLLPLLLIGLLFWQQRRRQKQMQRAQADLVPGQPVSTTSGLWGTLVSVDDQAAVIEAAPGIHLSFDKRAVLPRPAAPGSAVADDAVEDAPDAVRPDEGDQPRQGA